MPDKQHTYIKNIILTKKEFSTINKRIDKHYSELKIKEYCFNTFYSWSLLATILGIFTRYGNPESTELFLDCMRYNYLPKFSIGKNKNNVRICICIRQKELNERITKFENIRK